MCRLAVDKHDGFVPRYLGYAVQLGSGFVGGNGVWKTRHCCPHEIEGPIHVNEAIYRPAEAAPVPAENPTSER
jgi:hypothetical protein